MCEPVSAETSHKTKKHLVRPRVLSPAYPLLSSSPRRIAPSATRSGRFAKARFGLRRRSGHFDERYPVDTLAEALAEGIVTGRPSMPEFRLDVAQINDLIAYLQNFERIR